VAADSENWQEAVRAIEEKTQSLRKHQHKLRLRRVVLAGMTTLILATVISRSYVVETTPAATIPPVRQSVPISRPPVAVTLTGEWPPEFLLASEVPSPSPTSDTSTPTSDTSGPTSDTSSPATDSSSPTTDSSSPTTDTTSPTSGSDSPHSVVYKISGRVTNSGQPIAGVKIRLEGSKATTAITDANGYYAFNDLRAGGSYTVTPIHDKADFKPLNRSFDNLTQDGSADFAGNVQRDQEPPVKCDESRERQIIKETYSGRWRESVERERQKVIAENTRDGERGEATLVPREPQIFLLNNCKAATVIYKYTWQIKATHPHAPSRDLNVSRQRTILCGKMLGRWMCS
jgi:hypothetical protein